MAPAHIVSIRTHTSRRHSRKATLCSFSFFASLGTLVMFPQLLVSSRKLQFYCGSTRKNLFTLGRRKGTACRNRNVQNRKVSWGLRIRILKFSPWLFTVLHFEETGKHLKKEVVETDDESKLFSTRTTQNKERRKRTVCASSRYFVDCLHIRLHLSSSFIRTRSHGRAVATSGSWLSSTHRTECRFVVRPCRCGVASWFARVNVCTVHWGLFFQT